MSRDTPEGLVLSEFEAALDGHHRTLPFWSCPAHVRPCALLAAFDLISHGFDGALIHPVANWCVA